MISVVCVKWGDKYTDDYVQILKSAVARNTTIPHSFVCFTDKEIEDVDCVILPEGLQGWWNKLYLFDTSYGLNERVVYFDLDTIITGNIDWIMQYRGSILGLENLGIYNHKYEDVRQYIGVFQSGVLAWNYNEGKIIWDFFKENKNQIMQRFRGDGEFLHAFIQNPHLIQRMYPDKVVSYKYNCYDDGLPESATVVCFHGEPNPYQAIHETVKPWGVTFEPRKWVAEYWRV